MSLALVEGESPQVFTQDRFGRREQREERIRLRSARVVSDVIEIGRDLIAERDECGEDGSSFVVWLDKAFGWSERTAYNFMNVTDSFASVANETATIPLRVLYQLAAPKVPQAVRDEALALAEAGERVTLEDAKRMIEDARAEAEADAEAKLQDALEKAVAAEREGLEGRIADLEGEISEFDEKVEARARLAKLREQVAALKQQLEAPPKIDAVIGGICKLLEVDHLSDDQLRRLASTLGLAITVKHGRKTKRFEPVTAEESLSIQQRLATSTRIADALAVLSGAPPGRDMPAVSFAVHRNQARQALPSLLAWAKEYMAKLGSEMEDPRND